MAFDEPEVTGGERLFPKDIVNHLLMVWACEYVPHSPTMYTQPGKLSDMIVVDCVDLDQPDPETRLAGLLARRAWWRNAQLIQALKPKIGSANPVLARMGRGVATKGQPPFILVSATSDPQCVARGNAWLAANPDFKPSTPSLTEQISHDLAEQEARINQGAQPEWSVAPVTGQPPAETMLERMARQQLEGLNRLPPPPARSQSDEPPY